MFIEEQAVAMYNEAAGKHGFACCLKLTDARRGRLARRLEDIGGLDAFKRALSVIHRNDFLMGRVPAKPGKARFKLDLDFLLQTDSKLNDVLAKLLDIAGQEGQHVGQPETEDERRDRVTMGDERYARYRAMKADRNTQDGGHA
jgi:hypothetical protein